MNVEAFIIRCVAEVCIIPSKILVVIALILAIPSFILFFIIDSEPEADAE